MGDSAHEPVGQIRVRLRDSKEGFSSVLIWHFLPGDQHNCRKEPVGWLRTVCAATCLFAIDRHRSDWSASSRLVGAAMMKFVACESAESREPTGLISWGLLQSQSRFFTLSSQFRFPPRLKSGGAWSLDCLLSSSWTADNACLYDLSRFAASKQCAVSPHD